jgi:hypothetical protein
MNRVGSITIALTGWMVFGVSLVPLPSAAQVRVPQCSRHVGHNWIAVQANGFQVVFKLRQSGVFFNGTAQASGIGTGNVTGTMSGGKFIARVNWPKSSVGVYDGSVDNGGIIRGTTFDENAAGRVRVGWHSASSMPCLFPPKGPRVGRF